MNLPDTNIWLAWTLSSHPFHAIVHHWLSAQSARDSVLFCRATQQSFLRLLTTEHVMRPYGALPLNNSAAWALYERFLDDPRIAFSPEPRNLDARWKSLASRRLPSPKLWMDAYLAAFALLSDHQLITTDHAFTQFKDLEPVILSSTPA